METEFVRRSVNVSGLLPREMARRASKVVLRDWSSAWRRCVVIAMLVSGKTFGSAILIGKRDPCRAGGGAGVGPISKPSFRLSDPACVGKYPRYVFLCECTNACLARDILVEMGEEKKRDAMPKT